jgi:WXG100 family type VII secretion target
MSDGYIMAQFGTIEEGSSTLLRVSRQIQEELDQLKTAVAPLRATWTGSAAQEYLGRQAQADTAAADMPVRVQQMGSTAAVCLSNYQSAEGTNFSSWG